MREATFSWAWQGVSLYDQPRDYVEE